MLLQGYPWRPEAKRGEEFGSGDSSEMYRDMGNQSMVIIDHTYDRLTALIGYPHLENPIQDSGKNTLIVQPNADLDVMMFIKKPPAENSKARLGGCDPASNGICFPGSVTYYGAEV